ncbi:hypothetical protein TRFO_29350 [Tritrichomonas foetus]|uniref:Uncharacterized protein n=1 Tax=Tritrichomonas foetus TaxID=1144522 RepID=A0A1J4JXB6_9EUKA|nr:hypothetical protein TRFO_29350 [Tritrichomonas foetus]|eukprot:OHT03306.1 hypothetical protein TRFO_29350 [Tritrichomonas foetus]
MRGPTTSAALTDVIELQSLLLSIDSREIDEIKNKIFEKEFLTNFDKTKQLCESLTSVLHSRPLFARKYFELFNLISSELKSQISERDFLKFFNNKNWRHFFEKEKIISEDLIQIFEKNDNYEYHIFRSEKDYSPQINHENLTLQNVIKSDSLEKLTEIIGKDPDFNLNQLLDIGLSQNVYLIEYAAICGACKVFNFLYDQKVDIIPRTIKKYSIIGRCKSIIEKVNATNEEKLLGIKYNSIDISNYETFSIDDLMCAVKYYNVGLFYQMCQKNIDSETRKQILLFCVKLNFQDIAEYLLNELNIELNEDQNSTASMFSAINGNNILFDRFYQPSYFENQVKLQINQTENQPNDTTNQNGSNDKTAESSEKVESTSETVENTKNENGSELNDEFFRENILHCASRGGNLEIIEKVFCIEFFSQNQNGETPLHLSARFNNFDACSFLVSKIPREKLSLKDKRGFNSLHIAARLGNVEIVKLLNETDEDLVKEAGRYGLTPYLIAAHEGQTKVVEYLSIFIEEKERKENELKEKETQNQQSTQLNNGSDGLPNSPSIDGMSDSPSIDNLCSSASIDNFIGFSENNHCGNVGCNKSKSEIDYEYERRDKRRRGRRRRREENNQDVNSILAMRDKKSFNALMLAVHWNRFETACFLAKNVKSVPKNDCNCYGQPVLHASYFHKMLDLTYFFTTIEEFDLNVKDGRYKTLLHWAVINNDTKMVEHLIENCNGRVDIDSRDRHFQTPFIVALNNGHINLAKYLYNKGADINAKSEDDWTALHYAAKKNNIEALNFLTSLKHIEINALAEYGLSPLYLAAFNGHLEVAKHLVQAKSNVKTKDERSCTIFHAACSSNQPEMVGYLLTIGNIDFNAQNDDGMTALHLAARENYVDIVKMLLSSGKCDANIEDDDKKLPADYISKENRETLSKMFEEASSRGDKRCNIQ